MIRALTYIFIFLLVLTAYFLLKGEKVQQKTIEPAEDESKKNLKKIAHELKLSAAKTTDEEIINDIKSFTESILVIDDFMEVQDHSTIMLIENYSQELTLLMDKFTKLKKSRANIDDLDIFAHNIHRTVRDMSKAFITIIQNMCSTEFYESDSKLKALRDDLRLRGLL